MNRNLHIVSFDVPYPADYGGVIDVLYKIKALYKLGISIHLHCFKYGREEKKELLKYCTSVKYYSRKKGFYYLFHNQPYVARTRVNKNLLNNLLSDDYPVLLEGLHLGWYIKQLKQKNKKVFLRAHNVEHNYYTQLSLAEQNSWKKIYFKFEAIKLKNFEKVVNSVDVVFSISERENKYFKNSYKNATLVLPFHPHANVKSLIGLGMYALYHGNLSVAENIQAVNFLIMNVFEGLDLKLIVAGKNPSNGLKEIISSKENITLVENPSETELTELILNAHTNVLPTFQNTGLKLKLLAALFLGRHCLVNDNMIAGVGVDQSIVMCNTESEWKTNLLSLKEQPFTTEMFSLREKDVAQFSNELSATKIVENIFPY